MTNPKTIEDRLEQLGRELTVAESCRDNVMVEIQRWKTSAPPVTRPSRRWFTSVASLATAAVILMAIGLWTTRPSSLHAQALAALARAKSIHMTGFVNHIVRKWPVENPASEWKQDSYPVEAWYWNSDDGTPRSHEQQGPVIATREGSNYGEYQSDVDLLYNMESLPKDRMGQIETIETALRSLEKNIELLKELERREEAGRLLRGVSITRGQGIEEYWFDAQSNQLVRMVRRSKEKGIIEFDLSLSYDLPVPNTIRSYQHPVAKTIRNASNDEWSPYANTLPGKLPVDAKQVVILPRSKPLSFRWQYPRLTDDGKFLVVPLDYKPHQAMDLATFVKLSVCATPVGLERAAERPGFEYWRLEEGLADLTFTRSDLVCPKETAWQDWVRAALETLGLEYDTIQEERVYWIAQYDGRKRKPWREVNPPVASVPGEAIRGAGIGWKQATVDDLFKHFNLFQNDRLSGTEPIIDNQTGIPAPPDWDRKQYPTFDEYRTAVHYDQFLVASDVPWFEGKESQEMARTWFETQFGITFREEKRLTTIHVIHN